MLDAHLTHLSRYGADGEPMPSVSPGRNARAFACAEVTTMPRLIASIDRNIATCRTALKTTRNVAKRALLKALIDDLLAERVESRPHCLMCEGKGKALGNGQCATCDRRRCNYEHSNGDKCPATVENPYAVRCPLGHRLPTSN